MEPQIPGSLRVLLITEGTYPFYFGGVSTWCHLLLRDLPDVDFTLMSLVPSPRIKPQYELPECVRRFIPIPLWGICDALETRYDLSLADIIRRKRQTSEAVVAAQFVPILQIFLQAIFTEGHDPQELRGTIHQMYRFFTTHDFDATLRSRAVWDCFKLAAQIHYPGLAARHGYAQAGFVLSDLTTGMQWLYHWLFPLAKPLPPADVVHAAMVGVSTLVAMAAQLEYQAAYLLSEHGIYLREAYLSQASVFDSLFLKLFKIRFDHCMVSLSYHLADQISPCADYNKRWELINGAPADRLKTIYYGVDSERFTPLGKPIGDPPVVVWVGRINPLKDLETLLRAAALVHQTHPKVQFRLFGSASPDDMPYYNAMQALHTDLQLGDTVVFCGYVPNPETSFNQGDVVVLSSISEGFPFSILEAMLCGKPVVATAVGGVPEEIDGCGIAVEPRNPSAMAQAILALLDDPARCETLGRAAREKAVEQFSLRQSSDAYLSSYRNLSPRHRVPPASSGIPELYPEEEFFEDSLQPIMIPGKASSVSVPPFPASSLVEGELATVQTVEERRITSIGPDIQVRVADETAITALAVDIKRRVPLPIDSLEITALLESLGITDEVAVQSHGVPDVFTLAKAVLAQVRHLS
jgi:polysaccharide biosynthesis protein PelF